MLEIPPFRLDLAEGQLWRGSEVVPLRPRTWSVLRYLVERPGRLARHGEILDAVWADAAVTPNTLNASIRELRQALGDDARAPRYIETVHRRGFRFIGEFGNANEAASQASPKLSGPVPPLAEPGSLHGRSDALAELEARLAKAGAGRRQIAFVTGEIGIGKTSLLRAFIERHAAEQREGKMRVAWGQSVRQRGEGEAYFPVLDALDRLSRSEDRESLRVTLRRFAPTWLLQLPWLLESGESADLRRELGEVSASRLLREFCVATEVLASASVLVLVLEDLHWSDAATVDLIGALAERSDPARLLLLGSYRPVDAAVREHPIAPLRRALQQRRAASELSLDPLPETAVGSYLCERFGWQEAPAGLASLIADQVEGNPLFMVTLMDYLVSKQLLSCSEGAWSLAVSPESLVAAAPHSLRDIVEDQLGMLSARERKVLEVASAIGVSFAVQALAAGVEADVEVLEETCGELAHRRLFIEERELERWPDGTVCRRFGFQHSAFQRLLYARLSPSRRQRLHLRIGERIEAGHGEDLDAQSATLAIHFEQGGDRPRAMGYLARAASVSQQRFAHREAAGYLRRALELLEQTPESDARSEQELELRLRLGRDLSFAAGFGAEDARENLGRCLELSRRLGDERSEGFVLDRIARQQLFRSEYASLRGTLEQLLPIARQVESAALAADASLLAAHADVLCGEFERADRGFARVRSAEIDPSDAFDQIGHYSVTLGFGLGAWCTAQRGRAEEARCQSDAACSAVAVHQRADDDRWGLPRTCRARAPGRKARSGARGVGGSPIGARTLWHALPRAQPLRHGGLAPAGERRGSRRYLPPPQEPEDSTPRGGDVLDHVHLLPARRGPSHEGRRPRGSAHDRRGARVRG